MVKIDENIAVGKKVEVKKPTLFTRFLVTLFLMLGVFVLAAVITYMPMFLASRTVDKDFNWCMESKGRKIKEGYPKVCISKDGESFIQPHSEEEKRLLEAPINRSGQKSGE